MDDEPGSTSPTTADVADGMGIFNEEPPADEPLALVKKVKIKPDSNGVGEEDQPMDLAKVSSKSRRKTAHARQTTVRPAVTPETSDVAATWTTGSSVPQSMIYTYTNGVMPTVPQLVDLIPTAVNGKAVRPFKAYNANRELLTGLPTASYPSMPVALSGPPGAAVPLSIPNVVVSSNSVPATHSNGGPHAHLMTLATEADRLLQKNGDHKTQNGHIKTENDEPMTPGSTSGGSDAGSSAAGDLLEETIEKIKKRAGLVIPPKTEPSPPASDIGFPAGMVMVPELTPTPKRAHSKKEKSKKKDKDLLPDQMRDNHYWERRRKNNEAAKRSRDARRAKEDQIAIRAALLEQENMRLRIEVAALKEETVKLRAMLYNKK